WPPNQNAFAFGDSSICQLTRAAKCQFGDLAIGPARSAISAALYVGVLLASLYKAAEIFADRAALHRTATHLLVSPNPHFSAYRVDRTPNRKGRKRFRIA